MRWARQLLAPGPSHLRRWTHGLGRKAPCLVLARLIGRC